MATDAERFHTISLGFGYYQNKAWHHHGSQTDWYIDVVESSPYTPFIEDTDLLEQAYSTPMDAADAVVDRLKAKGVWKFPA